MALSDHAYTTPRIDLSKYTNSLTSVAKQRYLDKLTIEKPDGGNFYFLDPYLIKKEDWKDDVSLWPKISVSDIKKFLTLCPGKNYKSLSAYEYVVSGKVQRVEVYVSVDLPQYILLCALVQPSQKCNADCYNPWVLCKINGEIKSAHCTCIAGLGEACSHIAALLFKVQLGVTIGITSASTEKKCEWNNSFTKKVKAVPLKNINFEKTQWGPKEKRQKLSSPPKHVEPLSTEEINELKAIAPNAVYFTSVADSDSDTCTASEGEENEIIPQTLSQICQMHTIRRNKDLLPFFDVESVKNVEQQTRGQVSKLWFDQRCGRITSSNFGAILKRKKAVSTEFIRKFTVVSANLNTPSVKWGQKKENIAFQTYYDFAKESHINFQLRKAGLFISETDPYLASSPDGIIQCDCCGKGVLEIKCPFKYRNDLPTNIAYKDAKFCLDKNGCLKETHDYFSQIQGQMALTNSDYCDFVIWTTVDLYVRRIRRDKEYWDSSKSILESFYFKYIVPVLEKK